MPPRRSGPRGTLRRIILPASVVLGLGFGTYGFVELGSFLASEDPLEKADVIVVLSGTPIRRPLEGADLYLAGYGSRVVLSREAPEGGEAALAARGIRFASDIERAREVLLQLGIPAEAVLIPDRIHNNTAAEAVTLRELAHAHRWRRVIVVTSTYHLRRAGFAFRRELRGTGIEVRTHGTRYEDMDPEHWWRRRRDVREVVAEVPRLVAYVLGLGA